MGSSVFWWCWVVNTYGFMGGPVMALDAKGRVTVPAQFKEPLLAGEHGELYITKGPAKNLFAFPKSLLPQVKAVLNQLPTDARSAVARRMVLGHMTPVSIDSGGRILIPQELREFAKLDKEVGFMGLDNYFELWDKGQLAAQEEALFEGTLIKGGFESLDFSGLQRVEPDA